MTYMTTATTKSSGNIVHNELAVVSVKLVFARVFRALGNTLAITIAPIVSPITIFIVLLTSIHITYCKFYVLLYHRNIYKHIRHYKISMITRKDYELLTMIDKATPIKEIIKKGYPSSIVYNNLKKYQQNGLVIKKREKPVTYDTTIKGGLLLFALKNNEGLLK